MLQQGARPSLFVILPCRVIIAGAGIGGLVLAVALLKQGVDVKVFERDLTAIRGEGKYRGPIQVRSVSRQQQVNSSACPRSRAACALGLAYWPFSSARQTRFAAQAKQQHGVGHAGCESTEACQRLALQ
jgi:glycine/D-amino acid oxidase-like deaminating enzyme